MYLTSQTAMRKEKNTCTWLKCLTTERCGKSCMEEYCAIHHQMIRWGRPVPVPCQGCGIGTQSKTRLCKTCGQQSVNNRLRYNESRARKQYSLVIDEVKAGDFYFKWCLTDDICTEVPYHIQECNGLSSRRPSKRRGAPARSSPSEAPLSCSRTTNTEATQA